MTKVSMSTKLNVPADAVWTVVKGFNDLPDWLPPVKASKATGEGVGDVRVLTLPDGTKVIEKLDQYDDGRRTYSYSIMESPLPLAGYRATVTVKDAGKGCEMEWSSEFEPKGAPEDQARSLIEGLYKAGFDSLRKMFGG